MKQHIVKEALDMIRSQGIRIPRTFSKRILRRAGYEARRVDISRFKKAVKGLKEHQRIVVSLTRKGVLKFSPFESYQNQLRTAENARKHLTHKKSTKEVSK